MEEADRSMRSYQPPESLATTTVDATIGYVRTLGYYVVEAVAEPSIYKITAPDGDHWVKLPTCILDDWLSRQLKAGLAVIQGGTVTLTYDRQRFRDETHLSIQDECEALNKLDNLGILSVVYANRNECQLRCTMLEMDYAEDCPSQQGTRPSASLWRLIRQFNGICMYCRRLGTGALDPDGKSWHREHVWPKVHGGGEGSNIVLACAACNLRKQSMAATDFLAKLEAGSQAGGTQ
jgi:hypothetical protein